jgi:uncharacterized membrane protein YfcA
VEASSPRPTSTEIVTLSFVVAVAVVVFAGVAYGLAGFGFVMVSVPPLLLLYPPQTAVTTGILLSMLTGWMILPSAWRETQMRTVLALLPGALLGIGLGIAVLRVLETNAVKLLASIVVVLFAAAMIRGWTPRGMRSRFAPGIAGMLSGALGATTGMNGPPVVLLFVARQYEVHAFRASLVTYFLLVNIVAMAARVWAGETGWTDVQTALLLLPAAVVGTTIGRRLVHRVQLATFRRLVLFMVLVAGLIGVISAMRPWLPIAT